MNIETFIAEAEERIRENGQLKALFEGGRMFMMMDGVPVQTKENIERCATLIQQDQALVDKLKQLSESA